jgi:hypothetical protein
MAVPMTAAERADRAVYAAELEQLAKVSDDWESVQHYTQKAAKVAGALPIFEYIQRDKALLEQWREADRTGIADADGRIWSEANAVQTKLDELARDNAYRPGLIDEVNRLMGGGVALDTPQSQLAAAIISEERAAGGVTEHHRVA